MAQRVDPFARPGSLGILLAFCGMFAVGSLAVQLALSSRPAAGSGQAVEPVVAHPSTLWRALGEP
ncbi:MAG: hypothetical protein AAFX65_05280 [Cyanobacteria bacterium J06638_7]